MAKQATAGISKSSKPGMFSQTRGFIQEVKNETEKVTWLNREDLKANTQVVLLFLVILAFIVGVMDIVFLNAVTLLFRIT